MDADAAGRREDSILKRPFPELSDGAVAALEAWSRAYGNTLADAQALTPGLSLAQGKLTRHFRNALAVLVDPLCIAPSCFSFAF